MRYILETNLPAFLGLIVVAFLILFKPTLSKKENNYFIAIILVNCLMIVLQALDYAMAESNVSYSYIIRRVTSFLGYGLYPPMVILVINMFENKKLNILYYIPFAINFILCFISMWTYIVFKIDANNSFGHGPLYYITVITPFIYLLLLDYKVSSKKDYFMEAERLFTILLTLSLIVSIILEIAVGAKFISWNLVGFMVIIFYALDVSIYYKIDALTKLYTRKTFEKYIEINDKKLSASIIYFDINNFKNINDTLGHKAGDVILNKVGLNMKTIFSKYGVVYRIGGDEFLAIIFKNRSNILKMLEDFDYLNKLDNFSLAHGIYEIEKGQSIIDAVDSADGKMYELKKNIKEAR